MSECQAVGGRAIWIAEEDRVVEDIHTVKVILLPLVEDGEEGKVSVPLTASYVRVFSE